MILPDKSHVFALESDAFFAQHKLSDVAGHDTIDFAFIDGLHVFEQALRDVINVEKNARKDSVIVIHDCLPLDSFSSKPVRSSLFWSGDSWKVMAVLREFRPDLSCFTIPTAPTGLGVVTHLDPNNTVLVDHFDEIVANYRNRDYDWLVAQGLAETLGVFVNDWEQITGRITEANG